MGRDAGAVQRLLEVIPEVLHRVNPALPYVVIPCIGFPGKKRREAGSSYTAPLTKQSLENA